MIAIRSIRLYAPLRKTIDPRTLYASRGLDASVSFRRYKEGGCGGMNVYPNGRLARSDQREGIAGILGIDTACTAKEPSGVAFLAGSPVLWAT
jgi:hypothetical protein